MASAEQLTDAFEFPTKLGMDLATALQCLAEAVDGKRVTHGDMNEAANALNKYWDWYHTASALMATKTI